MQRYDEENDSRFLNRSNAETAAGIYFRALKTNCQPRILDSRKISFENKKDCSRHNKAERIYQQQACIIIL